MIGTKHDASQFGYEAKMLYSLTIHLTERFSEPALDAQDTVERNALLEAYLLHARNLIDFFLPGVMRRDDILNSHFVSKAWSPTGSEVDRLQVVKIEIDKRLAHLTRHRNLVFDGWPIVRIAGDLFAVTGEFITVIRRENPQHINWFLDASKAQDLFDKDYGAQYRADIDPIRTHESFVAPSQRTDTQPDSCSD